MPISAVSLADKQVSRPDDPSFRWDDPLDLESELSDDEGMVRDTARAFAQDQLMPRVLRAYRDERTDRDLLPQRGELGMLGATLPEEYSGAGLNYVAYGLIAREIERVDSGYRLMLSVQSSLVMRPILLYGTKAQRRKFLPDLVKGTLVGCFGLTEPDHGSDPAGMTTRAERARYARCQRHQRRISRHARAVEPGNRQQLRGHARYPCPHSRPRADRNPGVLLSERSRIFRWRRSTPRARP